MAGNKYRKKPVVIEAWEWNETKTMLVELQSAGMIAGGHTGHRDHPNLCENLRVHTLEGSMRANLGDMIIKGVKGEFYPVKPDIFAITYEPVDSEAAHGR